jgi:hypothetical protein
MQLDDALTTYTAGLDREIATLADVEALAGEQRAALGRDDLTALGGLAVRRAALMHRVAEIETELAPLRARLAADPRTRLQAGYEHAERRAHETRAIARRLLDADRTLVQDLQATLETRRREAHDLDTGGVTLAAYRRVVRPEGNATGLLDQRG